MTMNIQPLTKRQRVVLVFVGTFIGKHGFAPSLEEIGRALGLTSLATIHKHLTNIEEKGWIRRHAFRSRSLEVLITTDTCPCCGQLLATERSEEASADPAVAGTDEAERHDNSRI